MTLTPSAASAANEAARVIDRLSDILPGSPLHQLRALRPEALHAAEASDATLLAAVELGGVSQVERDLIGLRVAVLTNTPAVALRHRSALDALDPVGLLSATAMLFPAGPEHSLRTTRLLQFTDRLTREPHAATPADLDHLAAVGLTPRDTVTVAQLIAYLSFQVRVLAGLRVLQPDAQPTPTQRPVAIPAIGPAYNAPRGFTFDAVDWAPWLPPVEEAHASAEQDTAVRKTTPAGWASAYFALLAHDVAALQARTELFQRIMYSPRGLPRADRELASVAVSWVNGCVYCAAVHARRFAEITKRPEVIRRILSDGVTVALEPRERAIVDYAVTLTLAPHQLNAADLAPLRAAGLADLEILDLTHVTAMFAWANRLLETLGEVVYTD